MVARQQTNRISGLNPLKCAADGLEGIALRAIASGIAAGLRNKYLAQRLFAVGEGADRVAGVRAKAFGGESQNENPRYSEGWDAG